MGLAFLNKKSWHTGSFKSIEKVWIAEQKKAEADKKQAELAKKLKEERHMEEMKKLQVQAGLLPESALHRMEWIYEWGNKVQDDKKREDYLLGKPVKEERDPRLYPFTPLLKESYVNPQNESFSKLHEDPLFLIRHEELKRKNEIQHDLMKMKDIYNDVEKLRDDKDLKKAAKKAKKEKKAEKKAKKEKKKKRHSEREENDVSRSRSRSRSKSRERDEDRKKEKREKKEKKHRRRHSRSSSVSSVEDNNSDKRSTKEATPSTGDKAQQKKKLSLYEEYMRRRLGPNVQFSADNNGVMPDFGINKKRWKRSDKESGKEEDREKLVEQMKENAQKLEKEHHERHRDDYSKEEDAAKDGKFLKDMKSKVYNADTHENSLADRVSRNKHYVSKRVDDKDTFRR